MMAGVTAPRPAPLRLLAVLLALGAAFAFLHLFDPVGSGLYPPCLFRAATGLFCPGCGTARAFHALANGDLAAALRWNALAVLLLPPLLLFQAALFVRPSLGQGRRFPAALVWLLAVVTVAFGVLRNLPVEPFAALAPR